MNKGYEFDLTGKVFWMTESFARKASQVGTPEYQTFLKAKHDYPDVTVKKHMRQKSGRGLNYDMMLNYIRLQDDADAREKEFNRQSIRDRVQPMPYRFVLNWFEETFPDYYAWAEDKEPDAESTTDSDKEKTESDPEELPEVV